MIDLNPIRSQILLLQKLRYLHLQNLNAFLPSLTPNLLIKIILITLINTGTLQQVLPSILICLDRQHCLEIAFLFGLEFYWDC